MYRYGEEPVSYRYPISYVCVVYGVVLCMYVYCVFVIVSDYMALVIKLTIAVSTACLYTHAHVPQREWTVKITNCETVINTTTTILILTLSTVFNTMTHQ